MKALFYKNGETAPHMHPEETAHDDGSTVEFECSQLANMEFSGADHCLTAYTESGYWYFVLDEAELVALKKELESIKSRWFVTLFLVDRMYGGPEEGGWWYDFGKPILDDTRNKVFDNHDEALAYLANVRAAAIDMNQDRPPYTSVNGEGEYRFLLTEGPAQQFPKVRPHYE